MRNEMENKKAARGGSEGRATRRVGKEGKEGRRMPGRGVLRLTLRRQEFDVPEFFEFFEEILAFFSRSSYVSRHRD